MFLMVGMGVCGITQLIVACVYHVHPNTVATGKVIVAMSVLYIVGYNVSLPFSLKEAGSFA